MHCTPLPIVCRDRRGDGDCHNARTHISRKHGGKAMIDHVGFSVSDYARAKAFYEKALAPLGYTVVMEATAPESGQPAAGFGSGGKPDFWICGKRKLQKPMAIGVLRTAWNTDAA